MLRPWPKARAMRPSMLEPPASYLLSGRFLIPWKPARNQKSSKVPLEYARRKGMISAHPPEVAVSPHTKILHIRTTFEKPRNFLPSSLSSRQKSLPPLHLEFSLPVSCFVGEEQWNNTEDGRNQPFGLCRCWNCCFWCWNWWGWWKGCFCRWWFWCSLWHFCTLLPRCCTKERSSLLHDNLNFQSLRSPPPQFWKFI